MLDTQRRRCRGAQVRSGERLVSWNEAGRPGPPGPQKTHTRSPATGNASLTVNAHDDRRPFSTAVHRRSSVAIVIVAHKLVFVVRGRDWTPPNPVRRR
jgi:hypothetical protein